ncbi:hypothetical protein PABY_13940 [Pyrodictium abyssi]|uniref:Uncharacterized protein n=2 Tax=Pyrodictium abyssi TaxID=54256 RepID=A0ABM8IW83_9CREN|nr:hypothetical protein PABY_13940 [Pyrodictium abyssi]
MWYTPVLYQARAGAHGLAASFSNSMAVRLAVAVGAAASAYAHYRLGVCQRSYMKCLGLSRRGLLESFILASAVWGVFVAAGLAYAVARGLGAGRLYEIYRGNAMTAPGPTWFSDLDPRILPVAASLFWMLTGLLCFSLVQAFILESLPRRPWSPLLAGVLFVAMYNAPLLTGEWKMDDVIVLGMAYPVAYYMARNSIGLIGAYVAVYELPVAAAVLHGWGEGCFRVFVALRAAVASASLLVAPLVVKRLLRSR